jgi:hypothetical protein
MPFAAETLQQMAPGYGIFLNFEAVGRRMHSD